MQKVIPFRKSSKKDSSFSGPDTHSLKPHTSSYFIETSHSVFVGLLSHKIKNTQ